MGVWEVGGMGEKTKMDDGGSKIEWVSIRLAILDHPSSILILLPHAQPPIPPHIEWKAKGNAELYRLMHGSVTRKIPTITIPVSRNKAPHPATCF